MADTGVPAPADTVALFLDGARVIAAALAEPAVVTHWERPSVLADQTVGALCGHLARGGVWAVGEYLDAGEPTGPVQMASADRYYAAFAGRAATDTSVDAAVRARSAALAARGHGDIVATLDRARHDLGEWLPRLGADRLIAVIGGTVMRLPDYLVTRIVEQVVHLDDLARSLDRERWPLDPAAERLVIDVAVAVARRRRGAGTVIRALYRDGFAPAAFPVI